MHLSQYLINNSANHVAIAHELTQHERKELVAFLQGSSTTEKTVFLSESLITRIQALQNTRPSPDWWLVRLIKSIGNVLGCRVSSQRVAKLWDDWATLQQADPPGVRPPSPPVVGPSSQETLSSSSSVASALGVEFFLQEVPPFSSSAALPVPPAVVPSSLAALSSSSSVVSPPVVAPSSQEVSSSEGFLQLTTKLPPLVRIDISKKKGPGPVYTTAIFFKDIEDSLTGSLALIENPLVRAYKAKVQRTVMELSKIPLLSVTPCPNRSSSYQVLNLPKGKHFLVQVGSRLFHASSTGSNELFCETSSFHGGDCRIIAVDVLYSELALYDRWKWLGPDLTEEIKTTYDSFPFTQPFSEVVPFPTTTAQCICDEGAEEGATDWVSITMPSEAEPTFIGNSLADYTKREKTTLVATSTYNHLQQLIEEAIRIRDADVTLSEAARVQYFLHMPFLCLDIPDQDASPETFIISIPTADNLIRWVEKARTMMQTPETTSLSRLSTLYYILCGLNGVFEEKSTKKTVPSHAQGTTLGDYVSRSQKIKERQALVKAITGELEQFTREFYSHIRQWTPSTKGSQALLRSACAVKVGKIPYAGHLFATSDRYIGLVADWGDRKAWCFDHVLVGYAEQMSALSSLILTGITSSKAFFFIGGTFHTEGDVAQCVDADNLYRHLAVRPNGIKNRIRYHSLRMPGALPQLSDVVMRREATIIIESRVYTIYASTLETISKNPILQPEWYKHIAFASSSGKLNSLLPEAFVTPVSDIKV